MGKGRQVLGILLLASIVILTVLAGTGLADWGKVDIQAYCYMGDRTSNRYAGTVRVLDFSRAASNCNVMYNGCDGSCTACYVDESSREICVDISQVPHYY